MAHNCVDWTARPPARKTPLLVLTHGDEHVYTPVPKDLQTLQEIARREFNLGDVDICILSHCVSLCHGRPARITEHAWEHISPYIGCATVQVSRPRAVENQPEGDSSSSTRGERVYSATLDAASGDERYFGAKRKQPPEADENDQQMLTDTTSNHGNDPRTSSTEDDEELSRSPIRPRTRRRVVSEEEDEQEQQEPTQQPSDKEIKQEKVTAPSASRSAEPDIPIKQEKHASGNATQSTHTESDTQAQADGEKLMIRVAHPPSNQEAKFMTKSSTSVGKVLSGACKSFGLDADLATLYLIVKMEDEEGNMVDLKFPCDNTDSISRAGAEREAESRFLLIMVGET